MQMQLAALAISNAAGLEGMQAWRWFTWSSACSGFVIGAGAGQFLPIGAALAAQIGIVVCAVLCLLGGEWHRKRVRALLRGGEPYLEAIARLAEEAQRRGLDELKPE